MVFKYISFLHLLIVVIIFDIGDSIRVSEYEGKLIDYLFNHKGYNNLIRPVSNTTATLTVELGLGLIQIINVDEKNQIVISNVWLRLAWNDFQLQWNPSDFGNLNVIRVPSDQIWRPDIVLFNNADGNYEVSWKPNVLIYNDGNILWIPPTIFKSSCTIDVTYFPFDQQTCKMRFGSWTFDATQVALSWYSGIQFVDLSDFWKSETWDLLNCPGEIKNYTHPGQAPTTEIVYLLHIRRKTLFYTVNLILPCVLIAFLTFCVFYLPTESGEKMCLCISVLLALVVFLLLVSQILPPTSVSIPLISKYLLFTFILNIIAVIVTVMTINIHYRTPQIHQMPKWIRYCFMEKFPPLLLMKRPPHITNELKKKKKNNLIIPSLEVAVELLSNENENLEQPDNEMTREIEANENLDEIFAAVNFIAANLQSEDAINQALHDWKFVASVIDRMMLILFIIITTIGTFGILLNFETIDPNFNQDEVIKKFSSQL